MALVGGVREALRFSRGYCDCHHFNYAPPPAPFLTGLALQPGGILRLEVNGSSNLLYSLIASANLTDWLRLNATGSVSNGVWIFRDTNAANFPWRFYRVVWP